MSKSYTNTIHKILLNMAKFSIILSLTFLMCSPVFTAVANNKEPSQPVKREACTGVVCKSPPKESKCKIIPESDPAKRKSTDPKSTCCAKYKCITPGKSGYTTFHGFTGAGAADGKEIVMSRSFDNGGVETSSVADGGHDATANAADPSVDMEKEMAMMGRMFGMSMNF